VKPDPKAGQKWERLAESFLQKRGLKTLQRNFNCRVGEIDLVMRDGANLVFTEVRFRASDRYGTGAESVSIFKQKRIIRAAQMYLQLKPQHPATACRFDVISIGLHQGQPQINWITNAFEVA
jgi:putative endonuclease